MAFITTLLIPPVRCSQPCNPHLQAHHRSSTFIQAKLKQFLTSPRLWTLSITIILVIVLGLKTFVSHHDIILLLVAEMLMFVNLSYTLCFLATALTCFFPT
jgi:hypothetical protein